MPLPSPGSLALRRASRLAERCRAHSSLEAENKEGGYHQAEEPPAAFFRFPQPRLGVAVSACHRLCLTLDAAFGQSSALGKTSNALRAVFTNGVANPQAFVPKSHVGRLSEGGLNSCRNSAPQRT